MKNILISLAILFISNISFAQKIATGDYSSGLKLAYDNESKRLTGYYENYTGWDEATKTSQYSCIFYFEGTVEGKIITIHSYYPGDGLVEVIPGTLEIVDGKTVNIKLTKEHGGCSNVQHFADGVVKLNLEKPNNWKQIRFVKTDKTYFYSDKAVSKKMDAYLVKNSFLCVEKIENDWAYCTYYGKSIVKGWIKIADLN